MKSDEVDENYFESLGGDFDRFMSSYDVERRVSLMKDFLPSESRYLNAVEIGCGTGRVSEHLYPYFASYTVTDFSERLAREVGKRLRLNARKADALSLPFESESFDFVISSECIEHTSNPAKALEEMARITKPEGYLLITTPNKAWYPVIPLSRALKLRKFNGPENWIFPAEAFETLKRADCTIRRRGGCHLFPWQIPLAKKLLPYLDRLNAVLYPLMINFAVLAKKNSH